MNHFWIMVLRMEAKFYPTLFYLMQTSNCVPSKCLWVPLHTWLKSLESQEQDPHNALAWPTHWEAWPPHPHVVMPRSRGMWLETSFTSASLSNLGVYCKSTWSLSHSRNACLLTLTIAFCSLWRNQAKRLLKTRAFIVVWSWTLETCFWINGHLGVPSSMVTLWCAHKCHTKLYVVV